MNAIYRKIFAVGEVILVTFALVPYLTLGVYRLFPGFEAWQTGLGFPFPVFVYVIEVTAALALMLAHRCRPADYGLTLRPLKYHLDIALTCFLPVALSSIPLGMGLDYTRWTGALVMSAVNLLLLVLLGWMLRGKPTLHLPLTFAAGLLLLPLPLLLQMQPAAAPPVVKAGVLFITYALFVGFGEEILYRGYMQSRLNEVFGHPYQFFRVPFGWGAIIASLLFGLTHVGILRWILGINNEVTLAWGLWTIFSGLVFAYVREKTGSILAPALLHGLPQAIATAVMVFL